MFWMAVGNRQRKAGSGGHSRHRKAAVVVKLEAFEGCLDGFDLFLSLTGVDVGHAAQKDELQGLEKVVASLRRGLLPGNLPLLRIRPDIIQ